MMQNYFDNEAMAASSVHATMKPARGGKCLVTFSTYEDRKDALNRTTIMEDPATFRAKGSRQSQFDIASIVKASGRQVDTTDANKGIPKPPPMQLSSNCNLKSQTQCTQNNVYENRVQPRSVSNGTSTGSDNNEHTLRHFNRNSVANVNPSSCNRQTLRLGTVSIGEYGNNNIRKVPEKFDFLSSAAIRCGSGDTTPTNESLHSELHNTLSRAKLKETNSSHLEHQRNCPLHQQQHNANNHHHTQQQSQHHRQQPHNHKHPPSQSSLCDYQNVNINKASAYSVLDMSRKLQKTSLNGGLAAPSFHDTGSGISMATTPASSATGILKNGSRNCPSNSGSNKSAEKSIKFG